MDNDIVMDNFRVLNEDGLRYEDESNTKYWMRSVIFICLAIHSHRLRGSVTRSSFYRFLERHNLAKLAHDARTLRVIPEIVHRPGGKSEGVKSCLSGSR